MKPIHAVIAIACVAVFAIAAARTQDPLSVDPSIYNLKMNNERVRVFIVKFKPGQSIAVHKHPDHVVHAIEGGKIMIHPVGKDPVTMDVPSGATVFIPAESHSAKNVGTTNMRLLVVELKD